jgi:hypothetical protein
MYARVAGLDVEKDSLTVCLRTPGPHSRRSETRTLKTMFGSSGVMRDWLVENGAEVAAADQQRAAGDDSWDVAAPGTEILGDDVRRHLGLVVVATYLPEFQTSRPFAILWRRQAVASFSEDAPQ